jgi:L-lactate dehydrogenase complex protein LldG
MSDAREAVLKRMRTILSRPDLRFPPQQTEPLTRETRMVVTDAPGGYEELAQRFGEELETLHGTYAICETEAEARLALINRLMMWIDEERKERKGAVVVTGQEQSVLAWDPDLLPIAGIGPALADLGLKLVAPTDLRNGEQRDQVRHIRYGITGVEAAMASTGSMLVLSGKGTNRAASLLPFRHIALIPFSRLYRTMEEWLAEQRAAGTLADLFQTRANLTLISGPSKSADIEMALTLGVHGPKFVHAILFDDSPPDDDRRYRPSDLFEEDADKDFEEGGFEAEDDDLNAAGFDDETTF